MSASRSSKVTVIGTGKMGSSLARAFASAGHDVTVWNRSARKAERLADVARVAPTLTEAVEGAELVVVSLTDYVVSRAVVFTDEVGAVLAGTTVVQLTSGTPLDARDGQAWAREHGVGYVDGAILAYPSHIGTEYATVYYAGDREAFDAHLGTLAALASNSIWVSETVGSAAALDCAILEAFFGGCLSFLHGAALCQAEGVPTDHFFRYKDTFVGLIGVTADAAAPMVEAGDYSGDQCPLTTHVAAMAHIVRLSKQAGVDDAVPSAIFSAYSAAVAAGHGDDELPAVFETMRSRK